ncbi:MAG: thiol-activated cytolysin family protein [Saprospiraceae bacterium]|nr:thiol-activated cytolysin family protein [Saprospiraceae bacterium]
MKNQVTITLLFIGCLLCFSYCSNDDGNIDAPPATIGELLRVGNDPESFPNARTLEPISDTTSVNDDYDVVRNNEDVTERFVCKTVRVSLLDGTPDFFQYNSNDGVIYPGSLLQGKTLDQAPPAPIVAKRADGTISYNLNDGNPQSFFYVDEVKKSEIQNAMNEIISTSTGVVPSKFVLDIQQVHSQSQLGVEMGLNAEAYTAKIGGSMNFSADISSEQKYNRFLVKLNQEYYTMTFDIPTSDDEWFDPSVTTEQLSTYIQADNPATFVHSVTYGRIFYMLIESTSSAKDMRTSLEASYSSFNNEISGSVDINRFNELENTNIKVMAYGGDAQGSIELAGATSIQEIADKLAESTDIRAGLPISYVVRSVKRPDKIVGTTLATEYDLTTCELKGIIPPNSYRELAYIFPEGIGASAQIKGTTIVVYNSPGTHYAWYHVSSGQNLGVFSITDPSGPLGVSVLGNVGAAINFKDGQLAIFNDTGLEVEFYNYNQSDPSLGAAVVPTEPFGWYTPNADGSNKVYLTNDIFGNSDNFPFVGEGFTAGSRYFTNYTDGSPILHFFGDPSNRYARYDQRNNGTWDGVNTIDLWGDKSCPLERIGAACKVDFGGNNIEQLFFDKSGGNLSIWDPNSTGVEFSQAYVVN